MRQQGVSASEIWVVSVAVLIAFSGEARGQGGWSPVMRSPQLTRGTYGPRMAFGELGYRMNYGQMMGNPYGGLGSINYGFGSGIVPGYGGAQSVLLYNSAYNTPGTGPGMVGIYPPWAAIGTSNQNPAIFPPGSPNYPGFVRSPRAYRPVPGRR